MHLLWFTSLSVEEVVYCIDLAVIIDAKVDALLAEVRLLFHHVCQVSMAYVRIANAKQKQPGYKKVRGQSEATMVISDQKL